jgi:hypothetical protein
MIPDVSVHTPLGHALSFPLWTVNLGWDFKPVTRTVSPHSRHRVHRDALDPSWLTLCVISPVAGELLPTHRTRSRPRVS